MSLLIYYLQKNQHVQYYNNFQFLQILIEKSAQSDNYFFIVVCN